MSRYRLSVVCQSTNNDALGRLHDALIFLGKLAGPAGLEPATSWFVVVMREIDRRRRMTTKIPRLNDLRNERLITVDSHRCW